ncbi:MAG TPA: sulfate ABC transporter ATP-binding protein [Xanthobacteraceae bacterium]|nr:sulfate ABC transporter ATP-binding protein [Xanthobacteraceae bacterium]
MNIEVINAVKKFNDFTALGGVNLHIKSGELVALLGPSGSGKTTLLRIIAGLEFPDRGEVRFDGTDALQRTARERNVGFVFQHYALFRHMTVFENVAFGLRARPRRERLPEEQIQAKVNKLLDLVQLKWLSDRYPSQLSGGQRQRIALARALAIEPRVLLLDEPFGALDAKVRKELRRWLRNLHENLPVTSVFVTHDQDEALEVADRVVVMDKGEIEQIGTPEEVYNNPQTPFVSEFIGESVVVPIVVKDHLARWHSMPLPVDVSNLPDGNANLFVRPHEMSIVSHNDSPLHATVKRVRGLGAARRAEVALHYGERDLLLEIDAPRNPPVEIGAFVGLKPSNYRVFPVRDQEGIQSRE